MVDELLGIGSLGDGRVGHEHGVALADQHMDPERRHPLLRFDDPADLAAPGEGRVTP
jgi:hypothetical protein